MSTADWTVESDPADLAEQRTSVVNESEPDLVAATTEEVGEADPVDVIEQAIPVPADDDAYDRG